MAGIVNKVIIGDATIYHGDMRDCIPPLGECADMILSDVPYLLSSGGSGDYVDWHVAKEYDNKGAVVTCDINFSEFMPIFYNALRSNSHCYCMVNNRNVQELLNEAEKAQFRFHNLLVWDKITATPNRWGMKNCEFIGFFFKGKAKYWNDCGAKQLIKVEQENYADHPTSKPIALCENYIRQSTKEGETVLDPFLGSGSTAIAALKSGRKFIGCEIEEKWFNASVKRIQDFYSRPQQMTFI